MAIKPSHRHYLDAGHFAHHRLFGLVIGWAARHIRHCRHITLCGLIGALGCNWRQRRQDEGQSKQQGEYTGETEHCWFRIQQLGGNSIACGILAHGHLIWNNFVKRIQ